MHAGGCHGCLWAAHAWVGCGAVGVYVGTAPGERSDGGVHVCRGACPHASGCVRRGTVCAYMGGPRTRVSARTRERTFGGECPPGWVLGGSARGGARGDTQVGAHGWVRARGCLGARQRARPRVSVALQSAHGGRAGGGGCGGAAPGPPPRPAGLRATPRLPARRLPRAGPSAPALCPAEPGRPRFVSVLRMSRSWHMWHRRGAAGTVAGHPRPRSCLPTQGQTPREKGPAASPAAVLLGINPGTWGLIPAQRN